jgi:hypothetical protein
MLAGLGEDDKKVQELMKGGCPAAALLALRG